MGAGDLIVCLGELKCPFKAKKSRDNFNLQTVGERGVVIKTESGKNIDWILVPPQFIPIISPRITVSPSLSVF